MSDSVQPHRRQPTRLPCPQDSPGKNTGVGCHFLLQCRKVKSESEVAQSCPTLRDPMDCSLPGSSVHGIFQERVLEWGAIAFSELKYSDLHQLLWFIDEENMDILSLDMNFRVQVSEFLPCHCLSIYLSFLGISPHLKNGAYIGTCLTELFWGVNGLTYRVCLVL